MHIAIDNFQSWEDFEKQQNEESEADRGHYRINRVYRQMAAAPALYWSQSDDPDSSYLKNQRQWIQKNFSEYLGGQLHIHKNAASNDRRMEYYFLGDGEKEKATGYLYLEFKKGNRYRTIGIGQ